jgi:hypothetical protein
MLKFFKRIFHGRNHENNATQFAWSKGYDKFRVSHLRAALKEACDRCGGEGTSGHYKGCESCIASIVRKMEGL